jgi:hypothetical protein
MKKAQAGHATDQKAAKPTGERPSEAGPLARGASESLEDWVGRVVEADPAWQSAHATLHSTWGLLRASDGSYYSDPTWSGSKAGPPPEPKATAFDPDELRDAALKAGVAPGAVPDFVARVQHELPHLPSRMDPTREHMALAEYVEHLRSGGAPHLFRKSPPKGNGRDHQHVVDDPW